MPDMGQRAHREGEGFACADGNVAGQQRHPAGVAHPRRRFDAERLPSIRSDRGLGKAEGRAAGESSGDPQTDAVITAAIVADVDDDAGQVAEIGQCRIECGVQRGQFALPLFGEPAHGQDVDIADSADPPPQDAATRDEMAAAVQQGGDAGAIAVVPRALAGGGIGAERRVKPGGTQRRRLAALHASVFAVDRCRQRDVRVVQRIECRCQSVVQRCGGAVGRDRGKPLCELSTVALAWGCPGVEVGESRRDEAGDVAAGPRARGPAGGGQGGDPPVHIARLALAFRKRDLVGIEHRRVLIDDRLPGIRIGVRVTIGAGDMVERRASGRYRQELAIAFRPPCAGEIGGRCSKRQRQNRQGDQASGEWQALSPAGTI